MTAPSHSLALSLLPDLYAVIRFAPDAIVPLWASQGEFSSITRTQDELSIVCPAGNIPSTDRPDIFWRALKVHGPFQFDQVGILSRLASPLASANIGIFVISTFDTDYLLLQSKDIRNAISTLRAAGHSVVESNSSFNDTKESEG